MTALPPAILTKPWKALWTFPKWDGRRESLVTEVHGVEIQRLLANRKEALEPYNFAFAGDKAVDYPYLQVVCISVKVEAIDQWRFLETSVHIPML